MRTRNFIAVTSAITMIAFAIAITPVNSAYANPAVVSGARNFIVAAAAEAGLTPSEFVATTVGMATVASGYDITKGIGVNMADSVDDSLGNLIDAADYPAYDSLTSEEQEQWGTKANYDAAKYNSLLNAFGMGDDVSSFYGSGGGSLDNPSDYNGWSEVGKDKLQQIGRIGKLWLNGSRALFGDIKALFTGEETVLGWIGAASAGMIFDATNAPYWPSRWPTVCQVNLGNDCIYVNAEQSWRIMTNKTVKFVNGFYNLYLYLILVSEEPFSAGYTNRGTAAPSSFNVAADKVTYRSKTFYTQYWIRYGGPDDSYLQPKLNMTYNKISSWNKDDVNPIAWNLVDGDVGSAVEQISGYPEEPIPDDEKIYYPDTGITPGITYNYFVTPTRNNNIYNPDNQTGNDDWKADTEDNVLPLLNIQFDKLFPFCMLFDIQTLFDKVSSVTGTSGAQASYMVLSIPLDVPGFSQGETIDLNLQWLYDLLVTVRPFVQILLGAGLLFVTIRFWQGVLTG